MPFRDSNGVSDISTMFMNICRTCCGLYLITRVNILICIMVPVLHWCFSDIRGICRDRVAQTKWLFILSFVLDKHLLKCSTLWISWFPDNCFRILVYILLGKVYPYTISTYSNRAGYLLQKCIPYIVCFKWTFNDWIPINGMQYIQTLDRSTKW